MVLYFSYKVISKSYQGELESLQAKIKNKDKNIQEYFNNFINKIIKIAMTSTIILFVISIFIVAISSNYKSATELIYTNVINRFIREKLSFLSGQIAFPIGDILTIVFIVVFVYCMVTLIKKLLNTANIFNFLYKLFWMLVNTFSIVFFVYVILFGLNYHTPELSDVLIDKYNNKYATNVRVDVDNAKRVEVYNILVEKIKETKSKSKFEITKVKIIDLQQQIF